MAITTGGDRGVKINLRLAQIGTNFPKLAAQSIRETLQEGLRYLQEDQTQTPENTRQPYDTGAMRERTTTRVINQYAGSLDSPVDYTAAQEYGFFNVWAQRWISGRFFMKDAADHMDQVMPQIVEDNLGDL